MSALGIQGQTTNPSTFSLPSAVLGNHSLDTTPSPMSFRVTVYYIYAGMWRKRRLEYLQFEEFENDNHLHAETRYWIVKTALFMSQACATIGGWPNESIAGNAKCMDIQLQMRVCLQQATPSAWAIKTLWRWSNNSPATCCAELKPYIKSTVRKLCKLDQI